MILYHNILHNSEALMQRLRDEIPWREDSLKMGGRIIPIPRLQSWHGEPHCSYTYSRLKLQPIPFTPALNDLGKLASEVAMSPLNCVLCNYYRNGKDSVSWHSDDEPELGQNPLIASFSFGSQRRFQLRLKRDHGIRYNLDLPPNSLLVMRGSLQHFWQHQLPKTTSALPRINLTYRYIQAL